MVECKQPTQEQVKEFWVWCGFKLIRESKGLIWQRCDGVLEGCPFDVDLNNLFKYAVPEAVPVLKGNDHEFFGWKRLLDEWLPYLDLDEDPALALFWVLWQVKEGQSGEATKTQDTNRQVC